MPTDTAHGHTSGRASSNATSAGSAPTASDDLLRAAKGDDPSALRTLIQQGANPDSRNADGEPLLRVAQLAGQWDNVQLLVEHGADVNAHPPARAGDTVLAFYSAGQFDKVHWLLEHGADPGHRIETAAEPARVGAQPIVENIYWWPVQTASYPSLAQWQRKSQDLLAERGYSAPPQPPHLRKLQQAQETQGEAAVPLDEAIDAAEQRVRAGLGDDGSR